MAVAVKKYAERFADTEISRIFAVPNHHIEGYSPAIAIFSGYLCGGAITRTGGLATLQRGVRFLCIHTKRLLSTLCQTTTKAQSPRIIVTGAPTNNGNSCIFASCRKSKAHRHRAVTASQSTGAGTTRPRISSWRFSLSALSTCAVPTMPSANRFASSLTSSRSVVTSIA